ncbi:uncharacterized protein BO95DRAFT_204870 [Aspergillus brunneoviolaceus CBS 621.78]|uniref:Uncharacterized protein n=1 Tax=Aspergillus brunneoviolaceus CBS 621.78 TaxID=1450534 RepID=A0ACD1G2V7_9EURO|nr:hypothetical protein BO95DRAFT_204870 [Aspergillus brunneoviolaceus CBS 621.78]RAH43588.1 hypothetical protein BO95DRAFT_204870 [Aspergillus brunneoviolaceus CBS 621.78]
MTSQNAIFNPANVMPLAGPCLGPNDKPIPSSQSLCLSASRVQRIASGSPDWTVFHLNSDPGWSSLRALSHRALRFDSSDWTCSPRHPHHASAIAGTAHALSLALKNSRQPS